MDAYYYKPSYKNRGLINIKIAGLCVLLFALLAVVGYKKVLPFARDYLGQMQRDKAADSVEVKYEEPKVDPPKVEQEIVIPGSATLDVSFTSQSPNRNWNDATGYGDSCEEAALLMTHYYLTGQHFPNGKIPKETAMAELDKMIAYQQQNYGYARDSKESELNMEELGKFAHDYYGYEYKVINNLTQEDIKREIAQGNMVIVPVMTNTLRTQGKGQYSAGDVYHVLPIIGYRADGVITNDNGFTNGKNWFYSWDVIFSAIDQNHENSPARQGLVIYKK